MNQSPKRGELPAPNSTPSMQGKPSTDPIGDFNRSHLSKQNLDESIRSQEQFNMGTKSSAD